MKKFFKQVIYWLYDTLGLRFIWEKYSTPIDPNTKKHKPRTLFLWAAGLYIALFGLASQRYENRIDIIENRANAIFTQLGTSAHGHTISGIQNVKNMKCPIKPALFHPIITLSSLFKETEYSEMVDLLNDTIVAWKGSLRGVNLSGNDLSGLDLSRASFERSNLDNANLTGCILTRCNFTETSLINANLSNSNILQSHFNRKNSSEFTPGC